MQLITEDVTDLFICLECASFLQYGDLSSLALYGDIEEDNRREAIFAGEQSLIERKLIVIDIFSEEEFKIEPCDCCETKLHGDRVKAWAVEKSD